MWFLDASTHLYKKLCPSISPWVGLWVRNPFLINHENGIRNHQGTHRNAFLVEIQETSAKIKKIQENSAKFIGRIVVRIELFVFSSRKLQKYRRSCRLSVTPFLLSLLISNQRRIGNNWYTGTFDVDGRTKYDIPYTGTFEGCFHPSLRQSVPSSVSSTSVDIEGIG